MSQNIPLTQLHEGQKAQVSMLLSTGNIRRRLQDLGIVAGTSIECVQKGPGGDPIAYKIRNTIIALRLEDVNTIIVTTKFK
ncbi:MAG: FeoA family protein [Cellulosilyticum sp.]|nr:ferrous iron transport protein A [Cellulosilyticum sp.]MEE1070894.1 FeoA family protein [Cellulosilyticum sp.]